ncbi:unnamed protein product [Phytophthora fragariaefolia]|uniref:Unnamed protein product n=1 Tax=Phytophthora fragariaefolia TaxID=1490495 RepID=A0A9W6XPM3_9STRA|nr:unnamed protein product [Phytophthora fragariaefolia]
MSLPTGTQQADEQFLADVLALLDVDAAETELEPPQCSPEPTRKRQRPSTSSDTAAKPKRVRKDATPRVRNKAKIEILRHEIKGLEAVLASLQNSKRRAIDLGRRQAGSLWKFIASKQSFERERAEHQNMGLKRMLSQQCAFTRFLSMVLTEWDNLPIPDSSFEHVYAARCPRVSTTP